MGILFQILAGIQIVVTISLKTNPNLIETFKKDQKFVKFNQNVKNLFDFIKLLIFHLFSIKIMHF